MSLLHILVPPALVSRLQQRFDRIIARRMRPAAAVQQLESRSIYILPTRYGIILAAVLYVMLMGSINYSNNMGFLLTFFVSGTALVGMLYTYRNLSTLKLTAGRPKAVFAGDMAEFPLFAQTTNHLASYRIAIGKNRRQLQTTDIPTADVSRALVSVPAERRGRLALGRLRVETTFPLGWFRAWSWLELQCEILVYPRPGGRRPLPPALRLGHGIYAGSSRGNEDFAGIRRYEPSDSPAHIAWKALARGHEVLTKQFSDPLGEETVLDWDMLADLGREDRLSQLCQWVLTLHRMGRRYGLRLPGLFIPPEAGEPQRLACLEALALYE